MGQTNERQDTITQRRAEVAAKYPSLWSKIVSEWRNPGDDRAWLMYSANYLFRTGGVRWALDPLRLQQRLPEAPPVDLATDLNGLSFVLLTHQHADHLDFELLKALSTFDICWVVPEPILQLVIAQSGINSERIIVPKPLEPIRIKGIIIMPFEGLHRTIPYQVAGLDDTKKPKGVPATGYLIEFQGKRWLLPGDTRNYGSQQIPNFGPVDGLFAHLWLGQGCALMKDPPLLEAFCQFCISLHSRHIVVTHLEEFGREAEDYWDLRHYIRTALRIRSIAPRIQVSSAILGESISL
jgi:L-ascorbate metabolism protein UlaG (beta-lactamase superfamily)